jgi:excisionase family DNA binding protein
LKTFELPLQKDGEAMKDRRRPPVYVTTGEVGRACGVTAGAVKKWIRQGKIRAIRTPGGHFRIPIDEIERLTRYVVTAATRADKGRRHS